MHYTLVTILLYYCVLISVFFFMIYINIYLFSRFYSAFRGAPYVPTNQHLVTQILECAHVRKGDRFLELGCGDGRIAITAARDFGAEITAIDINPLLVRTAKRKARQAHVEGTFAVADIMKTDMGKFDIIYAFLLPSFMVRIKEKVEKEATKGSLFISHGFVVTGWEKRLEHIRDDPNYKTFYYRL